MELFFDTETTDKCDFKVPHDMPHQPDIIQIACILSGADRIYAEFQTLVDPSESNPGWAMGAGAEAVHGIGTEQVLTAGMPTRMVMMAFSGLLAKADTIVCRNTQFDKKLVSTALHRCGGQTTLEKLKVFPSYCTMLKSTDWCAIPGNYGRPKWPKPQELHEKLFGHLFEGAHDAMEDIRATRRCYYELKRLGL